MKRIKRFLMRFVSWANSLVYIFYWLLVHCIKSDLRNHIKKRCQGKTIDIIVNGPSFTNQKDVVKDDGNDKCMVNFAANTSVFWDIKPSFYCVSDPAFFRAPIKTADVELFVNNIKKVNWDMIFYVTYQDYKQHIKNSELDRHAYVHFVPFHSTSLPFSFSFRKLAFWLFRKGQAMPIPMSVSVPVIMNAINSGYSFINLYGYDQDWIHNVVVNVNNQVCLLDTHFYKDTVEPTPWMKNDTETFKMYEIMQTQADLFESYWFIKEYADYLGNVTIINKSPNSLIDAFDKK